MEEVVIAVDALPYYSHIIDICDYSGEQIFSKMALPLFKECPLTSSVILHAADEVTVKNNDKMIRQL